MSSQNSDKLQKPTAREFWIMLAGGNLAFMICSFPPGTPPDFSTIILSAAGFGLCFGIYLHYDQLVKDDDA